MSEKENRIKPKRNPEPAAIDNLTPSLPGLEIAIEKDSAPDHSDYFCHKFFEETALAVTCLDGGPTFRVMMSALPHIADAF